MIQPLTAIVLMAASASAALAQQLAQPADPPAAHKLSVTGTLRSRFYAWNWFEPASGNNQYVYSGNLLRLGLARKLEGWDWNVEFAAPFLLGLPANSTGTGPQQGALGIGANYFAANGGSRNSAMIFPKQAYIRFDGFGGGPRHNLQVGRFEFLDGSETAPENKTLAVLKRDRINARLIGNFGWTDVGRSFDGVHYAYAARAGNLTFVAGIATRGVFQVDGWGWNRTGFGYGSYTHQWGHGRHAAETRVFAIEYEDWRHVLKTDNRTLVARQADLANIRIDTFGGHSVHAFETSSGTVDLVLWGALQSGRWGFEAQRAHSFDVEGGIQPKVLPRVKPWLRAGFTLGSGDSNPNDYRHETFFQLLPTPRPFARTPFFNMMNSQDLFGILLLRPLAKVTLSTEFHSLRLSNANDLWYAGGGAFQPWTFGYTGRVTSGRRSLANLYDANLEYRMNRNITLTAYLGYMQGLAAIRQIYPLGKRGQLGYLEFLWRI